jgi:hypothetical protein
VVQVPFSALDLATSVSLTANSTQTLATATVTVRHNTNSTFTPAATVTTVQLPPGLNPASLTMTGPSGAGTYDPVTGLVVFPPVANFAPGQSSTYTVTGIPVAAGSSLTITSNVRGYASTTDANTRSNPIAELDVGFSNNPSTAALAGAAAAVPLFGNVLLAMLMCMVLSVAGWMRMSRGRDVD